MSQINVGFAGMTHLGINSAAATAARGFEVLGFDVDETVVAGLQRHTMPVFEPGLDELVASNASRLRFSADAGDLKRCDLVYISVDVPTDDEGKRDLTPVR